MGKIGKTTIFAGLGLVTLVFSTPIHSPAAISNGRMTGSEDGLMTRTYDKDTQGALLIARGGKGNGSGRWSNRNQSSDQNGYGVQDGSGTAARPQDGTGYGAKSGKSSGTCDGTGRKGKGRGNR